MPRCLDSALQKEDGSFCPAHALADGRMERAGRAGKADLARLSTGAALTKSAGIIVVGDEILAAKVGTSGEMTATGCIPKGHFEVRIW